MNSLVDLVLILIVAGICGAVAQAVFGFRRRNFLASIGIGVVGAYVGTFIARRLEMPSLLNITFGSSTFDIAWAILGSALLLFVVSLFEGARQFPTRWRRR